MHRRASRFPHLATTCGALLVTGLVLAPSACQREAETQSTTYYDRRIAPILEGTCVASGSQSSCHALADDRGNAAGNLSLESHADLVLRRDLLIDYGPYGVPALLVKVLPPQTLRLTSWDGSDPQFVTTDIAHMGGALLDYSSQSLPVLEAWIDRGASINNAPRKEVDFDLSPCSTQLGTDALFDPDTDPTAGDYSRFVSEVNPVMVANCAAGNCHGSPGNSLYLTCGETPEQERWNYFAAGDYVAVSTQDSELLRRTLAPSTGGTFHEGGVIFASRDDAGFKAIEGWATEKGGPSNVPTNLGFATFAERVQPMLVKRGCMMLGCHSAAMFHDYRLRGGSGGHFGLPATRMNYQLSLEQLALEAPNVNSSRLVRKNLPPGSLGTLHRGGALFAGDGDPTACDSAAALTGPIDEQSPYCVISAWFEQEKLERMGSAVPFSGIVFVRRPATTEADLPQDWESFIPGSSVVRMDATLDAAGAITLGAETDLSALCGLTPATSQARRPQVSWDGTRIAFSARSSASEPYRVYVVEGGACSVEPSIDAAPAPDSGSFSANGELVHNFDPAFAPDGRIAFLSTRGNVTNAAAFDYSGPQRTPADPSRLNANVYITEGGSVRQLTFLLNQELTPAFMSDGRLIMTAEKRAPDFYQLAGRRINLDGGDYHPLFGQRSTIGHNQMTDIAELTDKNLVAIFSDRGAEQGAGALVVINRSIGVDQRSTDPADYLQQASAIDWPNPDFFQPSIRSMDAAATGRLDQTQGAYKNPSPLPDGRILVSYAANVSDLAAVSGNFDLAIVDPVTRARQTLLADAADLLWPVAIFARQDHGVFESRPDEANGHTEVYTDERRDRSQVTYMDLPLLTSLLFQNTRTGRIFEPDGPVEIWENLPPASGVTSYADGGAFVGSDSFGQYYLRRQLLGSPAVYEDGSARILLRGGLPISLAVTTALEGESQPSLHFQREEVQFYPGEFARQSFPREFFNGLCGGCHGSISGHENEIAANPDILTQASDVVARSRQATDLRDGGEVRGPPFQ